MRDARPAGHQPLNLVLREVDGVREDRPRAEATGALVEVEIVASLGKEPPDLRHLTPILRQVRLPVRAVPRGQQGRLAQHLGRAADREARGERVPQAAVVAAMPSRGEVV